MIQLLLAVKKGQLILFVWAATPFDGSFPMSILFFIILFSFFYKAPLINCSHIPVYCLYLCVVLQRPNCNQELRIFIVLQVL